MTIFFEIATIGFIGALIGTLIVGAIVGFFLSRWYFKKELAKITNIHQAEISKIERGIGNPSIKTLESAVAPNAKIESTDIRIFFLIFLLLISSFG